MQTLLADRGRHRAPPIPDLMVAAAAERAGLTVRHVDKDVELIAVGSMTRTVVDAALVLDVISGHDPRDPASLALPSTTTASSLRTSCEGVTVGVDEDLFFADVDGEVARSVRDGIERLHGSGAQIRPIRIAGLTD